MNGPRLPSETVALEAGPLEEARRWACTRTAGRCPPTTRTRPTPGSWETFWARRLSARSSIWGSESDLANVITVQTIALNDQITAVQLLGRRMVAAVLLIQALGGGWTADELPSAKAASAP